MVNPMIPFLVSIVILMLVELILGAVDQEAG
jgi:hypothetical protein